MSNCGFYPHQPSNQREKETFLPCSFIHFHSLMPSSCFGHNHKLFCLVHYQHYFFGFSPKPFSLYPTLSENYLQKIIPVEITWVVLHREMQIPVVLGGRRERGLDPWSWACKAICYHFPTSLALLYLEVGDNLFLTTWFPTCDWWSPQKGASGSFSSKSLEIHYGTFHPSLRR